MINIQTIKKHKGKIFILIFIIFTVYVIYDTYGVQPEKEKEVKEVKDVTNIEKKEETPKETKVLVDVKGEINTPGVYELTTNNTVMDSINKAGGLTKQSDTSNINLSKKLEDEMVIIVYSKSEIRKMEEEPKIECLPCNNACITEEDEKAKLDNNETEEAKTTGKVNINTADETQLQTLDGIGESKAKAIIEYRNKNGNFKTTEDIKNVSGIGDSVYEKIKDNITV